MRRFIIAALACVTLATATGCLIPAYNGDTNRRANELLNSSDDMSQAMDEWERFWFLDQPSHMTIYRTHGGIL